MFGTSLSWISRVVLLFIASSVWMIFASLGDIPLKSFTLLYLRLYCLVTVALICSLLLTIEYYILEAEPAGPVAFYYPGIIICFGLSLLFPLVVITHYVFCSKLSWHHWLVLPAYILFGVLFLVIERKAPGLATYVRWRNFVIAIAVFHIYPTIIPMNIMGVVGAILTVIAHVFTISPIEALQEPPGTYQALIFMLLHLGAATTTAMSFMPMVLRKPKEGSDWSEYFSYSMSYVGAGKYAGGIEYHCYATTDYYGVQVRT